MRRASNQWRSRVGRRSGPTALIAAGAVGVGLLAAAGPSGGSAAQAAPAAPPGASSIDPADFAQPAMEYRPGVRWWWPGGAVESDVLADQLDYLAENGFGTVEINPFGVDPLPGDEEAVRDVYTPAFYEKLDEAIGKAEELGITVDLNMGTGWNANGPEVTLDDSERNLALGRATLTGAQLQEGGVAIPALAKSKHYDEATFDPARAELQQVVLARRTGVAGDVTGDAALFDDGETVWDQRISLDADDAYSLKVASGAASFDLPAEVAEQIEDDANYEVIATYLLPSGARPVDAARPDWFVVDHMSATETLEYLNEWLGEESLNAILDRHDNVRAVFNDSLELGTDLLINEDVVALAADPENNGIGYDFSRYLPTVYRQNLGAPAYRPNSMSGATEPYLTFTTDPAITNRILADYRTIVAETFRQGLRGFARGAHSYDLQYRQQAYNTPIDMIGAAEFVDIPEEEQHDEYNLRTAASGAHLYGRELATAEQYTLGLTPFQNTLDSLKVGFDMMATAGINNFFYHGFSYAYGRGSEQYGENGWAAFPTIGVNMTSDNTLSPYFDRLNTYAARLNWVGQQGKPSMDVAVYAPFNTRAPSTGATPVLNNNGYAWDAINDASLTADDTTYADGALSVNGGTMQYDALVVQSGTVPVATMQALERLADQGTPIIFYGALPDAQAGYADGAYAAEDAKVRKLARQILLDNASAYQRTNAGALRSALAKVVDPEITYDTNPEVRFVRRSLDDGGELTFIRNTATTANTITVRADDRYQNFYWLDQRTGAVHAAEVVDGTATVTLDPGNDPLGRGQTPAKPSNGIVLLAEPAGVTLDADTLSAGLPAGVDRVAPDEVRTVEPTSLTVTADNLDGVIGGEEATETFTEDVLGNWKDADFHGGRLQSVVADGIYRATLEVDKARTRKYVLDLGEVHTAATVRVNGEPAGQVLWAPYEVDITDLLVDGENEIEIAVTPRKKNRYYPAEVNTDGRYSMTAPQDAGLVGPISIATTEVASEPSDKVAPRVRLQLRPRTVKVGQRARLTVVVKAGRTDPKGEVRITRNGRKLRVLKVPASGTRTIRLPRLPRGTYRIGARYLGNAAVQPGSATPVRLKVVRR